MVDETSDISNKCNAISNKPDDITMLEIKKRKFLVGDLKLLHMTVVSQHAYTFHRQCFE